MVEAFQVLGTKAGRVSTESVGVLLILNVPFGGHLVVGRGGREMEFTLPHRKELNLLVNMCSLKPL